MSQPKRRISLSPVSSRSGVAILLGLSLSLLWLWACFGVRDDAPDTAATAFSGGEVPSSPGQPSRVESKPFRPTALIAILPATPERAPGNRSENQALWNTAPATPVSKILDWRRMPVSLFPERTAKEIEASLKESAAVVDLYDKRFTKANSFSSITREMNVVREQLSSTIRQQRESSLRILEDDPQLKTAADRYRKALERYRNSIDESRKFEDPYDRIIAAMVARNSDVKQRDAIHRLSTHYVAMQEWSKHRRDLDGLPFEDMQNCELEYSPAIKLGVHSGMFRLLSRGPRGDRTVNSRIRMHLKKKTWKTEDVPALVQILQVQPEEVRLELVAVLFRISSPESTVALARRAVFDSSQAVRDKAISALATRSPDVYRPILLEGLQYPWGPAADHAAQALVNVNDVDAVPQLERLLAQPNPHLPFKNGDGEWSVRELVRVNHMRNCYLCHAPSLSEYDTVRGFVPSPSQALPRLYYASRSSNGHFVRADVTYLRQDFSVMHAVKKHKPWPGKQRFDYLVRTRPITEEEATKIRKRVPKAYAQKNAVLYALHQLGAGTGRTEARVRRKP